MTDSLSWLGQFDMVCVSGSLPSGVSPEAFTDWMTRLRSQCPCIIFDSSREALVAGSKAAPWRRNLTAASWKSGQAVNCLK